MDSNKIFRAFLYVEIFFIIFFSSAILSYRLVLKGEMVTLPSLVGKTYEEARVRYSRELTAEEREEALNIIYRRTMEIKGAVKLAMGT